jgi:hypothetical protein
MKSKLLAVLFVLVPAFVYAEGVKIDLQAWQAKAYAEGVDASPAGGRLEVSGPFALFGKAFGGGVRFDVTALNGESVDFGDVTTLGNHAALRAYATYSIGGNLSVIGFGGFATAFDQDQTPVRRYPREYGVGLRFTDKASGSTFDVTACRSEATRARFGAGQLCFSGEVPLGPVRFGGDAFLDFKNDAAGKDLMRLRVGVSVPDLVKAVF